MKIELLFIDCDCVLTDGIYYVSSWGETIKSFYTRDFAALEKLLKDIGIFIITSSHDNCLSNKIKSLNDDLRDRITILPEIKNKYKEINEILKNKYLSWENVAYIGDSDNDLECIKSAKISGCPYDAIKEVCDEVDFISSKMGGHGAVEDFVNYLLTKLEK